MNAPQTEEPQRQAASATPPPAHVPIPAPPPETAAPLPRHHHHRRRLKSGLAYFGVVLCIWLILAFAILPTFWRSYYRHRALSNADRITRTGDGKPGDPINVSVVGSEEELVQIMSAADWQCAQKLNVKSTAHMVTATVSRSSYEDAPVSSLYYKGRKQDLAFEQPVGKGTAKRHHVRFWRADDADEGGRPIWYGAATFDIGVKVNKRVLQPTHRIEEDVDKERDKLVTDWQRTGRLTDLHWIPDFHTTLQGKNGGNDLWRTDGRLVMAIIAVMAAAE
jgi:hypothetical protein